MHHRPIPCWQFASRSRTVGIIFSVVCLYAHLLNAQDAVPTAPVYPIDVAVSEQTVYIADRSLPGIWKVEDGKPSIFFQADKKFRTPLNAIRCLAVDAKGQLLAGDSSSRNVYRFDASGKPQPLTSTRRGIGIPMAMAVDSKGQVLVADLELHQIMVIPAAGGEPTVMASIKAPRGLAVDKNDNVWVVSHSETQVVKIDTAGKVTPIIKGRPFKFPHHIALDAEGAAYVADGFAKTIWKLGADKPEAWCQGEPLDNPVGLAFRGEDLMLVDSRAKTLFAISKDGKAAPALKTSMPKK